jgi:hypothetical protein
MLTARRLGAPLPLLQPARVANCTESGTSSNPRQHCSASLWKCKFWNIHFRIFTNFGSGAESKQLPKYFLGTALGRACSTHGCNEKSTQIIFEKPKRKIRLRSIGAPIILGWCPTLPAHESESMLRTYLVCREKQANGTWEKHSVLKTAILLPQHLSCYGKMVSLRMLTNLRLRNGDPPAKICSPTCTCRMDGIGGTSDNVASIRLNLYTQHGCDFVNTAMKYSGSMQAPNFLSGWMDTECAKGRVRAYSGRQSN